VFDVASFPGENIKRRVWQVAGRKGQYSHTSSKKKDRTQKAVGGGKIIIPSFIAGVGGIPKRVASKREENLEIDIPVFPYAQGGKVAFTQRQERPTTLKKNSLEDREKSWT